MPLAALTGLFLFLGISSLAGNQFVARFKLLITDPDLLPPTPIARAVPRRSMRTYTAVQLGCLAALYGVKSSSIGILFPVLIALLVPVRSDHPAPPARVPASPDPELRAWLASLGRLPGGGP